MKLVTILMVREREVFVFGEFTLDVSDRRLLRRAEAVCLSPKAFDMLVALLRAGGRVATKRELLATVWPDAFVEEGILTVHASALRRALASEATPHEWIETVRGTGYRFVGPVSRIGSNGDDSHAASSPEAVCPLLSAGRSHLLSGSSARMPDALEAFRAALVIDPTCASAHAGLALTRCAQAYVRAVPHVEAYAEAKAAALRALAMDDSSADAQAALGTVLFRSEWHWAGAERSLSRALQIEPGHVEAMLQYGALHDALGDLDRGLRWKEKALQQAVSSPLVHIEIAMSLALQRKFDQALASARNAIDLDPTNPRASEFVTVTSFLSDDIDTLIEEKRRRAAVHGMPEHARAEMERRLTALRAACSRGRAAGASFLLQTFATGNDSRASVQRAACYASAGQLDAAFAEAERAVLARDPVMVYLAVHPMWDPLRQDARMHRLLTQVGLRTAAAAASAYEIRPALPADCGDVASGNSASPE